MKHFIWRGSAAVLVFFYLLALAAPFLSPYSPRQQFREFFYSPPTEIHFRDAQGNWHLRPFIYDYQIEDLTPQYREIPNPLPIYFLVEGTPYRWMGVTWRTHLFGLKDASRNIFLLGSDALGRDLFSRILHGARFSLSIGVVAVFLTAVLGTLFGALAGYFMGWIDTLFMRLVDMFLSLPGLFLILAIRAVFPLQLRTWDLYWVMVLIFTLIGWASVTRVIRGQVASLRTREYVLAARVAGASHWRILWHHILPFTTNYLLVQSTILIPAFILGEVTLSFLGVGVQEPDASWGNLLAAATSVRVMTQFPWLLSPAAFIFLTILTFNLIGDELKVLDKQARRWW
ncbi:ABC transporter permease [Acidobacteria bacterium AH-259-O06]|nr:ABC transporter permease [Acidobacteria bacterium AH-259-O06]